MSDIAQRDLVTLALAPTAPQPQSAAGIAFAIRGNRPSKFNVSERESEVTVGGRLL